MTEWHANEYFSQSGLQQAMAEEQLAHLTLHGNERILDVGCGDGKITAEIAGRVPRGSVLGVDPSRDMIGSASKQFRPPAHANIHFEVGDARRLAYRNEFDLVVSFNALHWVPEQEAALRSIRAALKPGGRALLRMVPDGPRTSLEDVIEQTRCESRWADFFIGFQKPYYHATPEDYGTLAEQSGYYVTQIRAEDRAWDFKTRAAFVAFARATFVEWTKQLPEDRWDAFITDVLDRYQTIAAEKPSEANTFKFYQMEVELLAKV